MFEDPASLVLTYSIKLYESRVGAYVVLWYEMCRSTVEDLNWSFVRLVHDIPHSAGRLV